MKHARKDYDRIQDPAGLIPEDEPVFLLRGQDRLGAQAVRVYADMLASAGGDPAVVKAAHGHADLMEKWPKKKLDDFPADPAAEKSSTESEAKPPEDS